MALSIGTPWRIPSESDGGISGIRRIYFCVMVIPPNITTPAYEAEYASIKISKDYLLHFQKLNAGTLNIWLERLLVADSMKLSSTARSLLVNKTEYAQSLNSEDFKGGKFTSDEKTELLKDLPDYFWLTEISLPDLFTANKSKIIDFFYPADLPQMTNANEIYNRWIQIRFPEALLKNGPIKNVYDMSVTSHYPIFRLERALDTPEW